MLPQPKTLHMLLLQYVHKVQGGTLNMDKTVALFSYKSFIYSTMKWWRVEAARALKTSDVWQLHVTFRCWCTVKNCWLTEFLCLGHYYRQIKARLKHIKIIITHSNVYRLRPGTCPHTWGAYTHANTPRTPAGISAPMLQTRQNVQNDAIFRVHWFSTYGPKR